MKLANWFNVNDSVSVKASKESIILQIIRYNKFDTLTIKIPLSEWGKAKKKTALMLRKKPSSKECHKIQCLIYYKVGAMDFVKSELNVESYSHIDCDLTSKGLFDTKGDSRTIILNCMNNYSYNNKTETNVCVSEYEWKTIVCMAENKPYRLINEYSFNPFVISEKFIPAYNQFKDICIVNDVFTIASIHCYRNITFTITRIDNENKMIWAKTAQADFDVPLTDYNIWLTSSILLLKGVYEFVRKEENYRNYLVSLIPIEELKSLNKNDKFDLWKQIICN